MTAKENIDKVANDSITPYREGKENQVKKESNTPTKLSAPVRKTGMTKNNNAIIYLIFILYLLLGISLIFR